MAIAAGSIITVGALNVVDRLQDAGLQDPRVPVETIRETGNDLVVGKVLTEADFNFQLTSWDVSCDMMAMLHGQVGDIAQNHGPAYLDASGTIYRWDTCRAINLATPWKRDTGPLGGHITSGVLIPAYFPTALTYRLGVTENAQQQVTLNGGSYYMGEGYPIQEVAAGDGTTVAFVTSEHPIPYRIGGAGGTTFSYVWGVLVDGVIQTPGVDYVVTGGTAVPGPYVLPCTITFTVAPAVAAQVAYVYFSSTAHALGQTVHATTVTAPAAVRGRDITIKVGLPSTSVLFHGVQSVELQASYQGQVSREMGLYDPTGRTILGTDCNGTLTIEPKDSSQLYADLASMTGVTRGEVLGYINQNPLPLSILIHDPLNPGTVLKSLLIDQAIFQPPGVNVRVNQPTQFAIRWEALNGTFKEIKGRAPIDGDLG